MEKLLEMFKEKLGEEVFTQEVADTLKVNFDLLVNEQVKSQIDDVKAEFEVKETEMKESNEKEISDFKAEVVESIDKYLDYSASKFFEDNKIAIVSEMKLDAAEKIVEQTKAIFESAQVLTLTQDDFDAAEALKAKLESTEAKLNDSIKAEIDLKEEIEKGKMQKCFVENTSELTQIQIGDVETMMDGLQFESTSDFAKKLDIVIEKVTGKLQLEEKTEKTEKDGIDKYLV